MYNDFFGFQDAPFSVNPDPRFIHTYASFHNTYTLLSEGIRERKGCMLLTGAVGIGKTTLLNKLIQDAQACDRFVFFNLPGLTFDKILTLTCAHLELPSDGDRDEKTQALGKFLAAQQQAGGTTVLFIDEAQNLASKVLKTLLQFSQAQDGDVNRLQMILAGQPVLETIIAKLNQQNFIQNLGPCCRLNPLSNADVGSYIRHRLAFVGCEHQELFPSETLEIVAKGAHGIPKLINIICSNALLLTYINSQKTVFPEIVEEVANELRTLAETVASDSSVSDHAAQTYPGHRTLAADSGIAPALSPAVVKTAKSQTSSDDAPLRHSRPFAWALGFSGTLAILWFALVTFDHLESQRVEYLRERLVQERSLTVNLKNTVTELSVKLQAAVSTNEKLAMRHADISQEHELLSVKLASLQAENDKKSSALATVETQFESKFAENESLKQALVELKQRLPPWDAKSANSLANTAATAHEHTGVPLILDTNWSDPEEQTSKTSVAVNANAKRARIAELLTRARRLSQANQLTVPLGNNAVETYQKILQLAPRHAEARAGIRRIVNAFMGWGKAAQQRGEWEKSHEYYQKARSIDPQDGRPVVALMELEKAKQANQTRQ